MQHFCLREACVPSRPSNGLRHYRQRLDLTSTIVVGSPKLLSVVYCYRFPSRPDRIKIGYSSRGLKRVAEQSTAFPEKPEVVFVIHHKQAKDMEVAFHQALASRQSDVMGTEWFDATLADVLKVSPLLRRAVGAGRVAARVKLALAISLVAAGVAAYPAMLSSLQGALDGASISQIVARPRYLTSALDGKLGEAAREGFHLARSLISYSGSTPLPWIAALHIPVLGVLPYVRLRKQAA
jgi:hypothetical protein